MKTKTVTSFAVYIVLLVVLLVSVLLSLKFGAQTTSFTEVWKVVSHSDTTSDTAAIIQTRETRTWLAIVVGIALAISGQLMQVVTRNPLADPGILGVNSGAALAVVIGFTIGGVLAPFTQTFLALLGASLAAAVVYAVSTKVNTLNVALTLVIVGTSLSAACGSIITLMILARQNTLDQYRVWQLGSVAGRDASILTITVPLIVIAFALSVYLSSSLNILALGDRVANALAPDVNRTKLLCVTTAVLLTGSATAIAGPVAFVGLVVPHVARALVGVDQRKMLAAVLFLGPILMVLADVIGRIIHQPGEVPVGVMTAFVGVPVFLYVVRKRRVLS
ncbi:MAG: iron ABC transporter permease [Micrococcaceae bacterium]